MRDIDFPPDQGFPDVHPEDPEEQMLYLRRFRGRYPQTAGLDEDLLLEMIRENLALCPPLLIRHPNDVLRFLKLRILIAPKQQSQFLQTVTRWILEAVDSWSATKRLDFIFKHVVGRPPPAEEPDFGPWGKGTGSHLNY